MADPLIFGSICIETEERVRQLNTFRMVSCYGIRLDNPKRYNPFINKDMITYSKAKKIWPLIIDEIEKREKIDIEMDLRQAELIIGKSEAAKDRPEGKKKPSLWDWIALKF